MPSLTIGFSTPISKKNVFAFLIRTIEGSPYSHAFVMFHQDDINRDIVYQASGLAVNFEGSPLMQTKEQILSAFSVNVTEDQMLRFKQFAVDNVGMPYSMRLIFGLFIKLLLKKINVNISNPLKTSDNQYVCSELVATILQDVLGWNLGTDPDEFTPKKLYDYLCSASGASKIL